MQFFMLPEEWEAFANEFGSLTKTDVWPPRSEGGRLYIAQIGTKNPDRREYNRIAARLRRRLESGVWATNVRHGGTSYYSDLRYSAGARGWVDANGELRQEGVDNVVCSLDEASARDLDAQTLQ